MSRIKVAEHIIVYGVLSGEDDVEVCEGEMWLDSFLCGGNVELIGEVNRAWHQC